MRSDWLLTDEEKIALTDKLVEFWDGTCGKGKTKVEALNAALKELVK